MLKFNKNKYSYYSLEKEEINRSDGGGKRREIGRKSTRAVLLIPKYRTEFLNAF